MAVSGAVMNAYDDKHSEICVHRDEYKQDPKDFSRVGKVTSAVQLKLSDSSHAT